MKNLDICVPEKLSTEEEKLLHEQDKNLYRIVQWSFAMDSFLIATSCPVTISSVLPSHPQGCGHGTTKSLKPDFI